MLLPHFKSEKAVFRSITTATGLSAHDVGRRFDFALAVSSAEEVLDDADVNLVVIGTRHDSHAELVLKSLSRGKHVFVEKPLALNDLELDRVIEQAQSSDRLLMVGFNRRFSPLALRARDFFAKAQGPLSIIYRINAGRVPRDHWINDPEQGGRIIGEVCHFVDLMQFLTGSAPVSVFAETTEAKSEMVLDADSVLITIRFADGSNGVIAYLSEGDRALPKERIEILGRKKALVLDDFRRATTYEDGRENEFALRVQDKGQQAQIQAVCRAVIEGRPSPIPLEEIINTTRATFRIVDSLRQKTQLAVE
jgi:polar amino acid transport system substrate-binding protein